MSTQNLVRLIAAVTGANVLLTSSMYKTANDKLDRNHEDMEARMDELEGTLRGHIGLIEESLERIEKNSAEAAGTKSGWGKGMGEKAKGMYESRGRDEKDGNSKNKK